MALAVSGGLASVLSPCVLPVIPVVMAGSQRQDRVRPLIVVMGLSLSFITMGVISSLFGALLIGKTRTIEIVGALIIVALGLMVMLDLSFFKRLNPFSNVLINTEGRVGGLVLGLALGLIWVPCVGPFLSSTLTLVATSGQLVTGIVLLGLYSLGLAIPMLIVGYSSQLLQNKLKRVLKHERTLRYVTGAILVAFGLYSLLVGNMAF